MDGNDFDGRVVLVTGAGSGIGQEAVLAFSRRGAVVYGADLNERGLAETLAMVTSAGGTGFVAPADVSNEHEVAAILDRIRVEAGRLDVAFNNAGITGRGAICNTASVAALTGPGGMCAYAASKHGVHGLTRVATMENGAQGIRTRPAMCSGRCWSSTGA